MLHSLVLLMPKYNFHVEVHVVLASKAVSSCMWKISLKLTLEFYLDQRGMYKEHLILNSASNSSHSKTNQVSTSYG